jgi:hypothetical protein
VGSLACHADCMQTACRLHEATEQQQQHQSMPAGRCARLSLSPIAHRAIHGCTFTSRAMQNLVPPRAGSPHPLYQKFIDRFSGGGYEELVMEVVHMANEVAAGLGDAQVSMEQQWGEKIMRG